MTAINQQAEREQFEAWAKAEGFDIGNEQYEPTWAKLAWEAWESRAALAAPQVVPEEDAFLALYFKAAESSQPNDWLEAALAAKRWHCALRGSAAPTPPVAPADAMIECQKCGMPAIHYLIMDNLPHVNKTPFCEGCSQEHEQTAQEVNDHEMRSFGGQYGLVTYHYEPLELAASATAPVNGELLEALQKVNDSLRMLITTPMGAERIRENLQSIKLIARAAIARATPKGEKS